MVITTESATGVEWVDASNEIQVQCIMINFQAQSVTRVEAKKPHTMLHGLLNALGKFPSLFSLLHSRCSPLPSSSGKASSSCSFRSSSSFILHQRPLHYLCPPMSELSPTRSASSFAFPQETYAVQVDLKFPKNAKLTGLKFSNLFFSKDRISLCKPGWP